MPVSRIGLTGVHKCRLPGSASPTGLILLGTVHTDPRGFSRTRALLDALRPDLILLEISPYSLSYRKEHAASLRNTLFLNLRSASRTVGTSFATALKHAQIKGILRQISLPFEYRASASYSRRYGAEVIPVDSSEFSREWIETWQEMISAENLVQLLGLESTKVDVTRGYCLAALGIEDRISPRSVASSEIRDYAAWQEREDHIAREVRSACARLHPVRPVYIGGWRHLLCGGEFKTLRELLAVGTADCWLLDCGPV